MEGGFRRKAWKREGTRYLAGKRVREKMRKADGRWRANIVKIQVEDTWQCPVARNDHHGSHISSGI